MLKVVENEQAIRRHRSQFMRSLKQFTDEIIPVELGHPGASTKAKVLWSERLGIWFFPTKIADHRYWNAFGVGRPEKGSRVSITCEINFPLSGIVVHRGKLGGGRKGVGKGLFEDHYRGVWEVMDDGGEETTVAMIGVLNSPRFARQVAQFVRKIARIKEAAAVQSAQEELRFDELTLREDLIGDRCPDQERETGSECDHGLIVRDLSEALRERELRTGNDGCRDLLVMNRTGRVLAVFQILTEMSPTDIHTRATQLLLDGLSLPGNPLLILALPHAPEDTLWEKLRRLNIDFLVYGWEEDRAIFPDLAACLTRIAS
jgi:hypothetical protein